MIMQDNPEQQSLLTKLQACPAGTQEREEGSPLFICSSVAGKKEPSGQTHERGSDPSVQSLM